MGASSQDLLYSQKRAKSSSFVFIRPILYKIQPLNNSRNNLLIWTSHQVNYFVHSQVLEWLYLVLYHPD